MDTDDFLARGLDSDDSDSAPSPKKASVKKLKKGEKSQHSKLGEVSPKQEKKKQKKKKKVKNQSAVTKEEKPQRETKTKSKGKAQKHKASLEKLKEQDPEFYEFLKKEDQELLDFDPNEASDDDQEEEEEMEADSDASSDDEGGIHKFPNKLEVMTDSEESESEEEGEKKSGPQTQVTIKMVNQWSKQLQESNSVPALHALIAAFKGAVAQASPDESSSAKYKVEGSTVFNAIVRVCLVQIPPTLEHILALKQPKEGKKQPLPSSSNKWKRVKMMTKSYIGDLMQLLSNMAEAEIVNVLLKHLNIMVPYYACFPKLVRVLMRKLISSWSTGEETSRVLAFLAISKLLRLQQDQMLDFAIKQMYMAYVRNSKFTSPSTLPLITFMQRSLVEVLAMDAHLTYQYAFIYIRQLAIHLRNAITNQKKDTTQAVYNWQYVHSLHLWARLLSQLHPNPTLQPLIYPLTQTIIGTIKLVPTAKYYPLRFHCCKALNILSESTGTYIPVLPFLVEIFELTDFNKKHKNISFKPLNFACVLKLSKAQLQEKSFRDGVIDQAYEHILESFHIHAHTIAFPELSLPPLLQIKKFLKQCKVANYTKQLRQIVDKVEETSKVITQRRKTSAIDLTKQDTVMAWERRSQEEGTPLGRYYATWRKMRTREQQLEIAGKDRASIDHLEGMSKPTGPLKASKKERKEFKGLFETDSEESEDDDEDADENRFKLKEERPKKKQKVEEESDEEYSDFDEADLERLAQSASEGEEEESEDDDIEMDDEEDESDDEVDLDDDEDDGDDIVVDLKFSDDDE